LGRRPTGRFCPVHNWPVFSCPLRGNAYGGAIEWTWTARHRAPFLDLPAEGKETRIRGVSVVRFKAEKIVEQRDYWDARTLIQQLDGDPGEA
jgi:steroid delta-isomerase-like uncharacterized protein